MKLILPPPLSLLVLVTGTTTSVLAVLLPLPPYSSSKWKRMSEEETNGIPRTAAANGTYVTVKKMRVSSCEISLSTFISTLTPKALVWEEDEIWYEEYEFVWVREM
ncbi:hypothetical protein QVD17_26033 [Tagetes erecta]|uniref:Uncharacterized protein n=1 Tax=Tagetes erecta TaxID=13708 RepID=A0AAD8NPQ0_TARER|nr:hypothetical protein QVD17_26033 [Tagetes erecta]